MSIDAVRDGSLIVDRDGDFGIVFDVRTDGFRIFWCYGFLGDASKSWLDLNLGRRQIEVAER